MEGECVPFNLPVTIHNSHFADESFPAIGCTGTDSQQPTKNTPEKNKN